MTRTNTLIHSMALTATLAGVTGPAAFASSPNAYLNGTYTLVGIDPVPESVLITVTFDGAGNYTGSDTINDAGSASTIAIEGTYSVSASGALSGFTYSGFTLSGQVSADGNTFVISSVDNGQITAILVGVKQSLANNFNVASGLLALASVPTGVTNTAAGYSALTSDTSGANNTAFGAYSLYSNTSGKGNAAQGVNALYDNTTGIRNLGIGSNALYENTTGGYNIALGFDAGYYITTGSNNIEIGAEGTSSDNGTIQIGSQGTQTNTKIAGIYGTTVTGSAVYVTSSGQLGVLGSSERFKTDITPMPELSGKLNQLRPVTFHYRSDPKSVQQYGLIAEEVDKVYPELVIRDDKGEIQGVRYEELAPMLLSETQKLQQTIDTQTVEIRDLKAQHDAMQQQLAELDDLKQELHAALRELKANGDIVARR